MNNIKSVIVTFIAIITAASSNLVYGDKLDRPEYLDEAAFVMFMANEVTKYCKELVENVEAVKKYQNDLKERLAKDGISNPKEEVKPMSMAKLSKYAAQEAEKNGGPFMFNAERYCKYGRNEIANKTNIGSLLIEANERTEKTLARPRETSFNSRDL